jgi:hypothetical protein
MFQQNARCHVPGFHRSVQDENFQYPPLIEQLAIVEKVL